MNAPSGHYALRNVRIGFGKRLGNLGRRCLEQQQTESWPPLRHGAAQLKLIARRRCVRQRQMRWAMRGAALLPVGRIIVDQDEVFQTLPLWPHQRHTRNAVPPHLHKARAQTQVSPTYHAHELIQRPRLDLGSRARNKQLRVKMPFGLQPS